MLRSGSAKSVKYLLKQHEDLLTENRLETRHFKETKTDLIPSIWQSPLHYLCQLSVPEQETKLKDLLSVCSLDFDHRSFSPIHHLIANPRLSAERKLTFFRIILGEKGPAAVKSALFARNGFGPGLFSLCVLSQADPLLSEIMNLLEKLTDPEDRELISIDTINSWEGKSRFSIVADPVQTAISMEDEKALNRLIEKGFLLIKSDHAAGLYSGLRSSNPDLRTKILTLARARHLSYFSQVLFPSLEAQIATILSDKNGPFAFSSLRRSLSVSTDLEILRLTAILADSSLDFDSTPNILAEMMKNSQLGNLVPELVLASCLIALKRNKIEVLTPLLTLSKAQEGLTTMLETKAICVNAGVLRIKTIDAVLLPLSILSTCGLHFRGLSHHRSGTELISLWKRSLISLKSDKFRNLTKMLLTSPEPVVSKALAYFGKPGNSLDFASWEALTLTLKAGFRNRDSTAASQVLLDWIKALDSCENEDVDEGSESFRLDTSAIPLRPRKSSLPNLFDRLSLVFRRYSKEEKRRLNPKLISEYIRKDMYEALMSSVPQIISTEQWRLWEKHLAGFYSQKEDGFNAILAKAPTDLFMSLYTALFTEFKTDKQRYEICLFSLSHLHKEKPYSRRMQDMIRIYENLREVGSRYRSENEDWDVYSQDVEGWVKDLAAAVPCQDLFALRTLENGLNIDLHVAMKDFSYENLCFLLRMEKEIDVINLMIQPHKVIRVIQDREMWPFLRELFYSDLQDALLQKLVQEEYLLHLIRTKNETEICAILPSCRPRLQLHRVAEEAVKMSGLSALEKIAIRLDSYRISRTKNREVPEYVFALAGLDYRSKFLQTTKRSDFAFLTQSIFTTLVTDLSDEDISTGLKDLIRNLRSEDFCNILKLLNNRQETYSSLWKVLKEMTSVQEKASFLVGKQGFSKEETATFRENLAKMARTIFDVSKDLDFKISVFSSCFKLGFQGMTTECLSAVLTRPWTCEEIRGFIQNAKKGFDRIKKTATTHKDSHPLRTQAVLVLSKVTELQIEPYDSETSLEISDEIADSDLYEFLPAFIRLLTLETASWRQICEREIARGHVRHLQSLMKHCSKEVVLGTGASMMLLACKAPHAGKTIETLIKIGVDLKSCEEAIFHVLGKGKIKLISLMVKDPLNARQAQRLLLSDCLPALISFKGQLMYWIKPLLVQDLVQTLVGFRKFKSLQFILETIEETELLKSAILRAGNQGRNVLFSIYGLAPAVIVHKIKAILNDSRLWERLLYEKDPQGLTPLHNVLATHVQDLDFSLYLPHEDVKLPLELERLKFTCLPMFPGGQILSKIPEEFKRLYQEKYEKETALEMNYRLNVVEQGPIYCMMSHLLVMKMAGNVRTDVSVGRLDELVTKPDSVCRLQFLSAIGYPLTEDMLDTAVRKGQEDVALFLIQKLYTISNADQAIIEVYKTRKTVFPKEFLTFVMDTFAVTEGKKKEFGREKGLELALEAVSYYMPYFVAFLSRAHPGLYLTATVTGLPLLHLLECGHPDLFLYLSEQLIAQRRLTPEDLNQILSVPELILVENNTVIGNFFLEAVRLELIRRGLLPDILLRQVLITLGLETAGTDFNTDQKGSTYIDSVNFAVAEAEKLRAKLSVLKEFLPYERQESPTQISFAAFEDDFKRYQVDSPQFSISVEERIWNSFKTKKRPWQALYLASQFCGSSGLLGLYQSHSLTSSTLHFRVSLASPVTEPYENGGFQVMVKPSWTPGSVSPYSCRLAFSYSLPIVYEVRELQDRLREFSISLNVSQNTSIRSIKLTCDSSLEMTDFEGIRNHVLTAENKDICGLKAFQQALQAFTEMEEAYFNMAMPGMNVYEGNLQVVRSSAQDIENRLNSDVPGLCNRLNRLLNPIPILDADLTIVCYPFPLFRKAAGFKVAVDPAGNVIWDFSSLPEYRLLKFRNVFHSSILFESDICQHARVTLDCESLLSLFSPYFDQILPQFDIDLWLSQVVSTLIPAQLWFEFERFGAFFDEIQTVLIEPVERKRGEGSQVLIEEFEFSRLGPRLVVHVPIRIPNLVKRWDPKDWDRVIPPTNALGLKALVSWTTLETWQTNIVVSHFMSSNDMGADLKSYEWIQFFEHIESLLRVVDHKFGLSQFSILSELNKEQIREMVVQRFPALWTPNLQALDAMYRDWKSSANLLQEISDSVSTFLLDFGLQATLNVIRIGEEQVEVLNDMGENRLDKNNMVNYSFLFEEGKMRLQPDYFTFQAEKVPYSINALRRETTGIELEIDRDMSRFKSSFSEKHGCDLTLSLELSPAVKHLLSFSSEEIYHQTLYEIRLFLCELQTTFIRLTTFSEMREQMRNPMVLKVQKPTGFTIRASQGLNKKVGKVVLEPTGTAAGPVFQAQDRTLVCGLGTDPVSLYQMCVQLVCEGLREDLEGANVKGDGKDLRTLALLSSVLPMRRRLVYAALLMETSPNDLELSLGGREQCQVLSLSAGLTLRLSSHHTEDSFLPQISDILLSAYASSAPSHSPLSLLYRLSRKKSLFSPIDTVFPDPKTVQERLEVVEDLKFYVKKRRTGHVLSGPEDLLDKSEMFPAWVAICAAKDRTHPDVLFHPTDQSHPLLSDRSESLKLTGIDDLERGGILALEYAASESNSVPENSLLVSESAESPEKKIEKKTDMPLVASPDPEEFSEDDMDENHLHIKFTNPSQLMEMYRSPVAEEIKEGEDDAYEPLLTERNLGKESIPEELHVSEILPSGLTSPQGNTLHLDPGKARISPFSGSGMSSLDEGKGRNPRENKVVPSINFEEQKEKQETKDMRKSGDSEVLAGSQSTGIPMHTFKPFSRVLYQNYLRKYPNLNPSLRRIIEDCIQGHTSPTRLIVPNLSVSDIPHVLFLIDNLESLEAVELSVVEDGSTEIRMDNLSLKAKTHLKEFVLRYSRINLNSLRLPQVVVQMSPLLEILVLDHCAIDDPCWYVLSKTVANARELKVLSLQHNVITGNSSQELIDVLEKCPEVHISLQGNDRILLERGLKQYENRVEMAGKKCCSCCEII